MHPILFEHGGLRAARATASCCWRHSSSAASCGARSRGASATTRARLSLGLGGSAAGAVLGSKLGMLLYVDRSDVARRVRGAVAARDQRQDGDRRADGRLSRRRDRQEAGRHSALDRRCVRGRRAAVARHRSHRVRPRRLLLRNAIGSARWAIHLAGADRHPVQLYEAALDFALARCRDLLGCASRRNQRERRRRCGNSA